MERLASLESEEAFNELNEKEAAKHKPICQSKRDDVFKSEEESSALLTDTITVSPVIDNHENENNEYSSSSADNSCPIDAPLPSILENQIIKDSTEDIIDTVPPPLISESAMDATIEDSIESFICGESASTVHLPKFIEDPTQGESIEDSIEAFISSSERKGSIHDAQEVSKFIDQEITEEASYPCDSSSSQKVTESKNPFDDDEEVPSNPFENDTESEVDKVLRAEESSKNPFDDDEPVLDDIKEENSFSPLPIRELAPASQAEDILSRLKDTTEIELASVKSENFSNTSSDQAIDVRPSSSANDADSSDGDLERLAVKIDESGNVMESEDESSIEMVDDDEKQKRAEMIKQEDLVYTQNEEKFMTLLQQLTDREAHVLEEQDEVDDRAKVVESDLRLAMKQDQRKEAELTGEWLALVQKRDDLLKSGSLIGLQRRRAKLELEYLHVQRQCRVLSLKYDYEKTEEDRNSEEKLIQQCVQLVRDKAIIEDEMADLEEEIQDQRERHAVQMQKNLMEQERQKQAENSTSIFGIKRSWFS